MDKIWISSESKSDKIISVSEKGIYKANPKPDQIIEFKRELESNRIPKDMFFIPFSYIKLIQLEQKKKFIQVDFGLNSEEHFKIEDDLKRIEIFNYLKENIPGLNFNEENHSALRVSRKPLWALFIFGTIFAFTLYFAIEIESGNEYVLVGSGRSVTTIILVLANLGVKKVLLLFGIILILIFTSIYFKIKNKSQVSTLSFRKV